MYRELVGGAVSTLMVLGFALVPANLSASAATSSAPTVQVEGQSHQALAAAGQPASASPAVRESGSALPVTHSVPVSPSVVKVDLVSLTKPLMPAGGPNWRCWGNILIWDPTVCIYVRYVGTKVLSIQGQIWMRVEGPVTGTWTMGWSTHYLVAGPIWHEGPNGRYGASVIANHWTTPSIPFNRYVPRNTYVYFAFWEWYAVHGKWSWHLKRVQSFMIV
jgi:hypothetical protein